MRVVLRSGMALCAVTLLAATAAYAIPAPAPEVDPSTGLASLVLLAGALTVIRSWRRR